MEERKVKLITVRTDKKVIEVTLNKREWKNLIASMIEFVLILITVFAVGLIPVCPIAMARNWSITGIPLYTLIGCFVWLGLIAIYSRIVNKPRKKKSK